MFNRDFWNEIWHTVSRQKIRSLLTAFGVFWGTFMLIVIVGAFSGLNHGFMGLFGTTQYESLLFSPKQTTLPCNGLPNSRQWNVYYRDLAVIQKKFRSSVRETGAIKMIDGARHVTALSGKSTFARVECVTPSYFRPIPLEMTYGRFVNDIDMIQKRRICVIGRNVADRLYGRDVDPCGQQLTVGQFSYKVVGVVRKTNSMVTVMDNEDNMVLVPYSTADALYGLDGVIDIAFAVMDLTPALAVEEDRILDYVRQIHNVSPDDDYALEVESMQGYVRQWGLVFTGVNVLMWVVGVGMLLAGVLGVFNIMLISISERRQELGIRLSLGCNPNGIVGKVICESLVLTLSSGFAGIASGLGVIAFLRRLVESGVNADGFLGIPQVPFGVAVSALLIMVVAGVLAGWIPSRKVVSDEVVNLIGKND